MLSEFDHSERQEIFKPSEPAYLAGIFESGGHIGFTMADNDKRSYARPLLSLGSENREFLMDLARRNGGTVVIKGKSFEWRLREQDKVAALAISMKPFAVSRLPLIEAIEEWEKADDIPEKIAIVEEFKEREAKTVQLPLDYSSVITEPRFLAGVIDRRGRFYKEKIGVIVTAVSSNVSLLTALKERYGGNLDINQQAGSDMTIHGKTYQIKNDVWMWRIAKRKARDLISTVYEYLKVKPYDEWSVRPKDEVKMQRKLQIQERNDKVVNFLVNELESGDKLLSLTELSEKFELSKPVISSIINKLPNEIKKKRLEKNNGGRFTSTD